MKKIPTLFVRNDIGNRNVRCEVTEAASWVVEGLGTPTRKFDGTCCMVRAGALYKRYEAKKDKVPPEGFEAAQDAPDSFTGKWPGWVPVGDGPEDKYHNEAWKEVDGTLKDGTYELCGPRVQGNPENMKRHVLVEHSSQVFPSAPRTFDALRRFFETTDIEGIVWHHPAGHMAKIKGKDFGVKRPKKAQP